MELIHSDLARFEAAERALTSQGRSFHWARRLLDQRYAARATRLYGFCRAVDDLADQATCHDAARARLTGIAADLACGDDSDAMVGDMLALMRECGIDPQVAIELVRGVASDLEPVRMRDERALLRYCYRVAGTVGLMMSAALDVEDAAALPHAIDLGIAMQLTNICRDVHEDALAGRRYLPATLVGDMLPGALVSADPGALRDARDATARLLALADAYYASGHAGLAYLPLRARAGVLVAARVYRHIGSVLRQRRCEAVARRAVVSDTVKLGISLWALLGTAATPSFWRSQRPHDARLHTALAELPYVHTQVRGV